MEKTKNEFSLIQNLYVDAMINNLPRKWKHILKISHTNYRNLRYFIIISIEFRIYQNVTCQKYTQDASGLS